MWDVSGSPIRSWDVSILPDEIGQVVPTQWSVTDPSGLKYSVMGREADVLEQMTQEQPPFPTSSRRGGCMCCCGVYKTGPHGYVGMR